MRRLLPALALLAVLPASAQAATVTTETYMECNGDETCEKYQGGSQEVLLTFRGAPGEANRVVMGPSGDGRVRVTDTGALLEPGPTCQAVSPNEALCPFPRLSFVDLGDGDDTASLALGPKTLAFAGDGADVLTGSAAGERLNGGPGADRVDGRAGDDVLVGSLEGEASDALDGGPGTDLVTYELRRQPMVLSVAGAASNPDALTGVEGLRGGTGDDVLNGSAGADRLFGGDGDDLLNGAGGPDELEGGPGSDRLSGGGGADLLTIVDATRDEVACGAGADRIVTEIDAGGVYTQWLGTDPTDVLERDCERAALRGFPQEVDPVLVDPRVRVRGRRAILRNPCATIARRPCRGVVRVGAGAARVTKRFRSGTRRVVVRLRLLPLGNLRIRVHVRDGREDHDGAWTADPRTPVG